MAKSYPLRRRYYFLDRLKCFVQGCDGVDQIRLSAVGVRNSSRRLRLHRPRRADDTLNPTYCKHAGRLIYSITVLKSLSTIRHVETRAKSTLGRMRAMLYPHLKLRSRCVDGSLTMYGVMYYGTCDMHPIGSFQGFGNRKPRCLFPIDGLEGHGRRSTVPK